MKSIVDCIEKLPRKWYDKKMSYGIEFRRRVLAYWNEGHSKRETAEVFKVSHFTLQKWKSQLNETGNLAPKKRKETWRKIDPAKLKKHVEQNPTES